MLILTHDEINPIPPESITGLNSTAAGLYGNRCFAQHKLYKTAKEAISSCRSMLDQDVVCIVITDQQKNSASLWTEVIDWRSRISERSPKQIQPPMKTLDKTQERSDPTHYHRGIKVNSEEHRKQLPKIADAVSKIFYRGQAV